MQHGIQIGELAKLSGLPIDTIRFYERKGLLRRPPRSEGGFRLFSPRDVSSLKFVQRAQALGFSLGEVRDLLFLRDEDTGPCSHVRDLLERKLEIVRHKMAEMRGLEGDERRVGQMQSRNEKEARSWKTLSGIGRDRTQWNRERINNNETRSFLF